MFIKKTTSAIEARQYLGTNGDELREWIGMAVTMENREGPELYIDTGEGMFAAEANDWIVKTLQDGATTLTVCTPAQFQAQYVEVEQPTAVE